MALLSLRKSSDKTPFVIEERDIIVGYDSTNGTKIEYINNQSGRRDVIEVDDTTLAITDVSEKLLFLSFADYPTAAGFINMDRIYSLNDNSDSNCVVIYDRGTTQKGKYIMTASKADVLVAMYEKQGYLVYAVESYSGLDIVFPAATGDISAKFQAAEILTIFGALDVNNGTYVVDSVAFGGGKTTVTLDTTGVEDDADTTGYIMVKA